jgi:hypothetical protein
MSKFIFLMNTKIRSFAFCLTACLLACVTGHAYEQDNFYLKWEVAVPNSYGVAYWENNNTGIGQIYLCNGTSSNSRVSVYDLNGSLVRHITIAEARGTSYDLDLDEEGNVYIVEGSAVTSLSNDGTFRWRKGNSTSISSSGLTGSNNGQFHSVFGGLTLGPDDNLYIADCQNSRIQVLDKNGSFIRKFGSFGTAPGQFDKPRSIRFISDSVAVISDSKRLHWFNSNGSFIKRVRESDTNLDAGYLSVSKGGLIISYITRGVDGVWYRDVLLLDNDGSILARLTNDTSSVNEEMWRYCFTSAGDLIISANNKIQYLKRAYRTKGLPQRNVIPQPKIHKIAQRSGTNVLDLDFEIIDSDDTNATVGIMAYAENARVVPQAWTDGTGSKIGTPIATNEVHRVSWDVKQDWNTSTGTIKFEILCQDGRTNKPVDVHFLTLPLADGNLTISRSPIKDTDIENYLKYLVAIGSNEVAYENSTITNGSGTIYLNASKQATAQGKTFFMTKLGHRWATSTEVNNAKVAATPGTTIVWAASRQVSPRGLPKNVNEYGFDTGNHGTRAWWVVKE